MSETADSFQIRPAAWCWLAPVLAGGLFVHLAAVGEETARPTRPERFISYTNDVDPELPLSIHVVRIEIGHPELDFYTTLGGGESMGMELVSEQLQFVPPEVGRPLAAINGDFYEKSKNYPVRPRDVQIRDGELVTQPAGHTAFWMDANGRPQMTNIQSRFRIVWPDGKSTPFNLNMERAEDGVVLYTAALGKSTLTEGGVEYLLESVNADDWPPLRIGRELQARVRAVRPEGNTPLDKESLVLSVGPKLVATVPALAPGATLKIVTETTPDLDGATVAIGGGPSLVENGKPMEWKGWVHIRHPRTALGWNKTHLFLVQVDGRQLDVSVGMTFAELAAYMIKLGCEQAMNLDGGGSATLWAFGAVRNNPSEGQERPAPNTLVIVRKHAAGEEAK